MASIELPLPHDPADYEPKAVAGKFSYRAFATIVAVVASEVPLILNLVARSAEDMPSTTVIVALAALPAALIGLIGLAKKEGLYFEQWFPPYLAELMTPDYLNPVEARPPAQHGPSLSRADERAMADEAGVLESEAAALVRMATSGTAVPGRNPSRTDAAAVALEAVDPSLLVMRGATAHGIRPREARRLAKRVGGHIPCDPTRTEEVRSHKWVGKRLAGRACTAAAELAGYVSAYDVRSEGDVLAVLEAFGIEAAQGALTLRRPAPDGDGTAGEAETAVAPSPAEASAMVAIDELEGPPLSVRTRHALRKANVTEVSLAGEWDPDSLRETYGICSKAADELCDAMRRHLDTCGQETDKER